VYLAAHGFSWWLIGEVEETDSSSEDSGVQEDKFSPAPSGVLGSPTPAS
jgi:maltose alpha-D-glucosyltransferase / alpha-amylase